MWLLLIMLLNTDGTDMRRASIKQIQVIEFGSLSSCEKAKKFLESNSRGETAVCVEKN